MVVYGFSLQCGSNRNRSLPGAAGGVGHCGFLGAARIRPAASGHYAVLRTNLLMTTFTGGRLNTNIVVTGGGLTASLTTAVSNDCPGFTNTSKASGKWTFKMRCVTLGAAGHMEVGFGTGSASLTTGNFMGFDTNSCAMNSDGVISINGTNPTGGVAFAAGDDVWCAIDFGQKRTWWRTNTGSWNPGNAGANPDTNVGGVDISSLASFTLFPGINLWANTDSFTADFTSSSGLTTFTAWDAGSIPLPAMNLSVMP